VTFWYRFDCIHSQDRCCGCWKNGRQLCSRWT